MFAKIEEDNSNIAAEQKIILSHMDDSYMYHLIAYYFDSLVEKIASKNKTTKMEISPFEAASTDILMDIAEYCEIPVRSAVSNYTWIAENVIFPVMCKYAKQINMYAKIKRDVIDRKVLCVNWLRPYPGNETIVGKLKRIVSQLKYRKIRGKEK